MKVSNPHTNGLRKMLTFNHLGNLGRLANQMFQYASLKGIATNRGYEFCIPPEEAFGQLDLNVRNTPINIHSVFNLSSNNKLGVKNQSLLRERTHEFDRQIFNSCPDNVDLFGYFQSPKYFENISEDIRNDFTFSKDVDTVCSEMFESIQNGSKVIALHIRRTDYLTNPNHPSQPMSYYESALKNFDKNDRILVFSDDPEWCQQQEIFADDTIMISQGNDADIDLCLMSKCNYHIIANSSFSWWGAWLAKSEKIIAPKNWFASDCINKKVTDMTFGNWVWL